MEWSTVAFFGIAVVLVVGLCWLGIALYAVRKGAERMREMDEDFEERREENRRRFGS